jgi:hypothetical protein
MQSTTLQEISVLSHNLLPESQSRQPRVRLHYCQPLRRRPPRSWAGHRSVPPCLDWYLTHALICSRVPTPPRRRPPSLPRLRPTSASQGRRAHCAAAIPRAREKKRGNVRARKGERTRASMVALPHPCPPPARHARGRSCRRRGTRAAVVAAGAARARPPPARHARALF